MFTPFCKLETRDHYVPATTPEYQAIGVPLEGSQTDGSYYDTCAISGSFERVGGIYNNAYCSKSVPYYGSDLFPNHWIISVPQTSSGYPESQHFVGSSEDRRYSAVPVSSQYTYESNCVPHAPGSELNLCHYNANEYQESTVVCANDKCSLDGFDGTVFNGSNDVTPGYSETYINRVIDSESRCSGEPEVADNCGFLQDSGSNVERFGLENESDGMRSSSIGGNKGLKMSVTINKAAR
ncbi:uncharacterized protein LOC115267169 [Aedes albopictus]|uniref:Uncharacterized protein n=1 Tax=Aedes albopictus TaxID=7160 RepID=A0ABM1Z4C9_AEDAL